MANNNTKLGKAKKGKNDEFYTQLSDIENEMRHYKEYFRGKTVYCNCDDPYESNFFRYFALNFNALRLKKLIAISYAGSPVAGKDLTLFEDEGQEYKINSRKAYKVVMVELKDVTGDGREDMNDVKELCKHRIRYLKGDGSFQSEESIELLKEADIVVTNPPFSQFREYVAQLMTYNKQFIIIGNQNAITYKEIFPLIMNNQVWLGYGFKGNVGFFINSHYEDYAVSSQHKDGMIRVSGVMWFTNLETKKRHEKMDLYKNYTPEEYPHYENYDAIEVSKTANIPLDYDGIMGVPITFMDKYCPDQFEIIGMCENLDLYGLKTKVYTTEECRNRYFELFGKKGTYDLNASGVVDGKKVYQRILIRRKKADTNED